MIDGIPKLTGNSYLAKGSLPATYAELKAAFESGTQGLDLIFNAGGWQAVGMVLSKANLLSDATANAIKTLAKQSSAPSTPTAALSALVTAITATNTAVAGGAKIATGSYVGTGTYGADNPCVLTFDFVPLVVFVYGGWANSSIGIRPYATYWQNGIIWLCEQTGGVMGSSSSDQINFTQNGTNLSWHGLSSYLQLNETGSVYRFVALG